LVAAVANWIEESPRLQGLIILIGVGEVHLSQGRVETSLFYLLGESEREQREKGGLRQRDFKKGFEGLSSAQGPF